MDNGWINATTLPTKSRFYNIICICRIPNPEANPELIVRDGDLVVHVDYFDTKHNDWKNMPMKYFDGDGWEVIAWKELEIPDLPDEYKNAVSFEDLQNRQSYREELLQKEREVKYYGRN